MQHPESVIVTINGVKIYANYEPEPVDAIDGAALRDGNDIAEDVVSSMFLAGR